MNDINNKFMSMQPAIYRNNGGTRQNLSVNTATFVYMGKAPKAFKFCRIAWGIGTNINSPISPQELAVMTGPFKFNSATALKMAGYIDITNRFKTRFNAVLYSEIMLNRTIFPKEDVWIGISTANLVQAVYADAVADDIQTGCLQTFSGRISTNFSSDYKATTLAANTVIPPYFILNLP